MKWKILAATAVLAAAAVVCLTIFVKKSTDRNIVKISQDGKLLYTLDLGDKENLSREIVVEYHGKKNVLTVDDGTVFMKSADCPDQTCVKMGELSVGAPIICLPNRLVVEYAQSSDDDSAG